MTLEQIQQRIQQGEPLQIIGTASQISVEHDSTLDMSNYQGIVEYHPEELVITVKAGTRLQEIEEKLSAYDQALPFFTTSRPNSTIGGSFAIGNAELRDSVLGVKVIDGRGRLLTFGGQTMKNVAGYDIARLLVGSKGKLAVICEISFKVFPTTYLSQLEQRHVDKPSPSSYRSHIEQGLKQVFDPNTIFL